MWWGDEELIGLSGFAARRRWNGFAVTVLSSVALVLGTAPAASALPSDSRLIEITLPDRNGEIPSQWLTYAGPPRATVLLPADFDPHKTYPLLLLLHGLYSNHSSWSRAGEGQIATTAAGFDGIIVMPEGASGWYTDWWNNGQRGNPAWESYLLDEVVPHIAEQFPIRPERRWHAIAGVSMGGLGAAYLAGRLPGYFGSVAILSGLVDTHLAIGQGAYHSLTAENAAKQPFDPNAVYGPDFQPYSLGHDPVNLVRNLGHTRVFMASGNGIPTEDGQPYTMENTDPLAEAAAIRPASDTYAAALNAAGIPYTYLPGDGVHDWPKFRTELRDALAWGMFQPVDEAPTTWVNDTVAAHGRIWGIDYRFDTPPSSLARFTRSENTLSISPAGSDVELDFPGGCTVHIATPATLTLPAPDSDQCTPGS